MKIDDLDEGVRDWLARKGAFGTKAGFAAHQTYAKNTARDQAATDFVDNMAHAYQQAVNAGVIDVSAPQQVQPEQPQSTPLAPKDNSEIPAYIRKRTPGTASIPAAAAAVSNGQQVTPDDQAKTGGVKMPRGKKFKVDGHVVIRGPGRKWYHDDGTPITDFKQRQYLEQKTSPSPMAHNYVREDALEDYDEFDALLESAVAGAILEAEDRMTPAEWAKNYVMNLTKNVKVTPQLTNALNNLATEFGQAVVQGKGKFPQSLAGKLYSYAQSVATVNQPQAGNAQSPSPSPNSVENEVAIIDTLVPLLQKIKSNPQDAKVMLDSAIQIASLIHEGNPQAFETLFKGSKLHDITIQSIKQSKQK